MAEERPPEERQRSGEPGSPANPLIAQEELDKAIAEAQESILAAREVVKQRLAAAPPLPPPQPAPKITLPPDRGVLKQDELDQVLRDHIDGSKPAESTKLPSINESTVSAPAAQDEIDLLLRSMLPSAEPAPAVDQSSDAPSPEKTPERGRSVISQDELDNALAMAEAASRRQREVSASEAPVSRAAPLPALPTFTLPPDLGVITQDELDHVIQDHAEAITPKPVQEQHLESEPAPSEAAQEDDIGALLNADSDGAASLPKGGDPDGPVSEPGGAAPPAPVESTTVPDTASISQEEIDRILREGDAAAAAQELDEIPDVEFDQFDQGAVDRLIREAAEQAAADGLASGMTRYDRTESSESTPDSIPEHRDGGAADANAVDQDDIDALLASLTGEAKAGDESAPPGKVETPSLGQSIPVDSPLQPSTSTDDAEQLSQEDLDQILAGLSAEESLNNQNLDDPLTADAIVNGADMEAEVVANGDADQSDVPDVPALESVPDAGDVLPAEDPVERATRGAAESEVGSENLAAAAPQLDDLLESITRESKAGAAHPASDLSPADSLPAKDELDLEIADASIEGAALGRDDMVVQLGDEELADMDLQASDDSKTARKDFRRSLARNVKRSVDEYVRSGSLKTWGSLAAGLLCTVATFLFLQSNQQRMPSLGMLTTATQADLGAVVRSARELIAMEKYQEAQTLLEPVVSRQQPGPSIADAHSLYIESRFRQLPSHITDLEAESLHRDIDELVAIAPAFHRNPELLRWKASLYERSGALAAALSTYKTVADEYADNAGGDETLIAAARLAGDMKHPDESEKFLLRLLQRFPASPHAPEAKLLLGDAQRAAGMFEDARKLYAQVAFSQDFSPVGAKATARLAELELEQGNFGEAIAGLERRLETATTVEGNDAIYLLLAKAYRGNGDLDKAETILRELISFFPESEHTAAGFVELSQTLDAVGNRREALKIASQASQRYPEIPEVLMNEGELLQRAGDDGEAAKVFLAAVETGDGDPRTLLAAGQAFARVNELVKARQTFNRLLTDFPTAPEAFEGSIALAKVLQKQGQSQAALERLTNLADASVGRPQQISLLLALGDLYRELGFSERAARQYEDAAAVTNDAAVLATSAVSLMDAGDSGPGLSIARRVDASELSPELAYRFLTAFGKALLQMDTAIALEKMEQAYTEYPDHRTEDGDRALLRAYLVTGQTARARALVMDLSGYVRSHPDSGPRLLRTAVQWADALFRRGDYTAAAEAYALAVEAAPEEPDADWARFQQANALMKLDEYARSLELLETVAEGSSPFAEDARLKADYARLEQRLRGVQVPAQMGG